MVNSKVILFFMLISSLIGLALSFYALHVKIKKEGDSDYKAMCDISEHMSCSLVLTSKWSKGFGLFDGDSVLSLSNSIYGIIFYTLQIFLSLMSTEIAIKSQLVLSVAGNIGSVYLACILYFILHDFCVVCVSTYVVNAILLICGIYKLKMYKRSTYLQKQD